MSQPADSPQYSSSIVTADSEVIQHLRQSITSGEHWYIALLEAIGLWTIEEENYNGRHYRYLIDGEAFDWLLLAERLCQAVDSLVPEKEILDFLFFGKPPIELPKGRFKTLIGSEKYRAHLNYFYGVTVEEVLISAVEEEVRKERRALGFGEERGLIDEAHRRIYGATRTTLLRRFRAEKGYPQRRSIELSELKEFTYWLFKYRMKQCDKSRLASDTKKGLEELRRQQAFKKPGG